MIVYRRSDVKFAPVASICEGSSGESSGSRGTLGRAFGAKKGGRARGAPDMNRSNSPSDWLLSETVNAVAASGHCRLDRSAYLRLAKTQSPQQHQGMCMIVQSWLRQHSIIRKLQELEKCTGQADIARTIDDWNQYLGRSTLPSTKDAGSRR